MGDCGGSGVVRSTLWSIGEKCQLLARFLLSFSKEGNGQNDVEGPRTIRQQPQLGVGLRARSAKHCVVLSLLGNSVGKPLTKSPTYSSGLDPPYFFPISVPGLISDLVYTARSSTCTPINKCGLYFVF